jgi:hypothetical protein
MFKKIKGGIKETIYGVDCYTPPPPPVDQIENSFLPEKDQKWQRTPLPSFHRSQVDIFSDTSYPEDKIDWDSCVREEMIKQTGVDPWSNRKVAHIEPDPEYVMDCLEDFRDQELTRCNPWSGGHWILINGNPVWLTPFHYFFLQWWSSDNGYPDFRDSDRKKFYYWQWVFENPMAHGMVEAASRGQGKSIRALACVYLVTIYTKNCISGMQSKTDRDAEDLFQLKLVESYKQLPEFFVPLNSNPSSPKSELSFTAPSVKGARAATARIESRQALNSVINYRNSGAKAYDGQTINGILYLDEEGKTETCDVYERHKIVEKCVFRDGKLRGKIYSTTTVAEMDNGGENYKKVWDNSDPNDLDEYGQTRSKLFRIFIPSYETEFFDEYGYPVVENPTPQQREYLVERYGENARDGAKPWQAAKRRRAENDPQALLIEVLQSPWSESELFAGAGSTTPYNLTILRQQEQALNESDFSGIRKGDFVFKGGDFQNKVVWVDNEKNGKWNVRYLFPSPKDANKRHSENRGGRQMPLSPQEGVSANIYKPLNTANFTGGFDPTKVSSASHKSRSKAAGTIFRKLDPFDEDNSETWIAEFCTQPENPFTAWVEFLAGCVYYGCEFLAEDSVTMPLDYFRAIGYYNYIMMRPRSTFSSRGRSQYREGLPSTSTMNDRMVQMKQQHIIDHGHKLFMPLIIKDSISFNPSERTKFDVEVASQLSLMATVKRVTEEVEVKKVESIFNMYDNSGNTSRSI